MLFSAFSIGQWDPARGSPHWRSHIGGSSGDLSEIQFHWVIDMPDAIAQAWSRFNWVSGRQCCLSVVLGRQLCVESSSTNVELSLSISIYFGDFTRSRRPKI